MLLKNISKSIQEKNQAKRVRLVGNDGQRNVPNPKEAIKLGFVDAESERLKAVAYLDTTKKQIR